MRQRKNKKTGIIYCLQSAVYNQMSHQRTVCGYTLIETLVALMISLIGLTGGLVLYRSGQQVVNTIHTTNELQLGVRKAFGTMIQELQETSADTIDLRVRRQSDSRLSSGNPPQNPARDRSGRQRIANAISFASAREGTRFVYNPDGTPDWKYAIAYFLDARTNTLYRYVVPKDNWETRFNTASAFRAVNLEPFVPDITNLEFQLTGNLLRITIESSRDVQSAESSAPLTTKLTTRVYLRN